MLAEVKVGELPQWQMFKLHVTDPEGEAELAAKTPREAPPEARWECLDLAPHYNGDVRAIFQQRYLSPRPKTCSVRWGWTAIRPGRSPTGTTGRRRSIWRTCRSLADGQGRIMTPQNVPFTRFAEEKNIALTSLWDNWPRSVTRAGRPSRRKRRGCWSAVRRFPMQTRIANAEVRFRYADGQMEKLELVPPLNFWSLCPWGGVDYSYRDRRVLPAEAAAADRAVGEQLPGDGSVLEDCGRA